jgi:hypothetical protein
MRPIRSLVLAAGVLVLAPPSIQADVPGYKIQSIAKSGDPVADVKIAAGAPFEICALNDSGQIIFDTLNAAGGEMLIQYNSSDGKFIPIAVGGRDAPGGKWPRSFAIYTPVAMNQQGDLAFETVSPTNTYRWDHQSGQVSIVAAKGMPAANDLTFIAGGDIGTRPAINDSGEIAFQATVKDSAGNTQKAIFFLGRDGKLVPVVLPGQTVDGVGTIELPQDSGWHLTLNNAGVVCFGARRAGAPVATRFGIFLWQNGTITPVLFRGADAPGGGKFADVGGGIVNNKNSDVLLIGNLDGNSAHWGIYDLLGGHLVAVAVPGQEMPGGGRYVGSVGIASYASSAGENAFMALLEGGDIGVYRVDASGKLSLIVKSSDLGAKILFPGSSASGSDGMAINGKGQVVLPVRFTGDKVDTLILMTPVSP